jgi:predicted MFS family arabinose efflux permease
MFESMRSREVLIPTLLAAGILLITMGTRQSVGLYVGPMNTSTGLGIATISFALAIGQFVWGAIQPLAGAAADKYGPRPVLMAGLLVLALGTAITPWMASGLGLTFAIGLISAAGAGASSFSVLIGAASQKLPPTARGTASGIINAGGSLGQFVFAPIIQKLIQTLGWMGSMWSMAIVTLLALPMVSKLAPVTAAKPLASAEGALSSAVKSAMKNPSYLLLHLGFFTCGFHIAFLVTHLPTEVDLCGLPPTVASWSLAIIGIANIAGSLYAGACINRYPGKYILAAMYASRALFVALYIWAPKTDLTFYLFAAGMGFTWLATVPPTAAVVGKIFGVRYLATLFGLTLLTHQIGGFLGAYLGGLALTAFGNYESMWWADVALALFAALVNLPIREASATPIEAASQPS